MHYSDYTPDSHPPQPTWRDKYHNSTCYLASILQFHPHLRKFFLGFSLTLNLSESSSNITSSGPSICPNDAQVRWESGLKPLSVGVYALPLLSSNVILASKNQFHRKPKDSKLKQDSYRIDMYPSHYPCKEWIKGKYWSTAISSKFYSMLCEADLKITYQYL